MKIFYISILQKVLIIILIINLSNSQKILESLEVDIDKDTFHHEVYEFLQDNLFHILTEYPNDPNIKEDFDELFETNMKNLVEPKSFNYIISNLKEDKIFSNRKEIKNFKEGENVDIRITTLVYVPGKIMVAPIFLDYPHSENKIPHITLMQGGHFRSIDGDYLLKSLFFENEELKSLYKEGFIKDPKFQVNLNLKNVRIIYEDRNYQEFLNHVYLVKMDSHLVLNGKILKVYSK
jgi:hypothetical protein